MRGESVTSRCLSSPPMSRLDSSPLLLACVARHRRLRRRRRRAEATPTPRRAEPRRPPAETRGLREGRGARAQGRRRRSPSPRSALKAGKTYVATVVDELRRLRDHARRQARARAPAARSSTSPTRASSTALTFHRIVAGFVIQGGDPKGDGTGGPGYTVVEKPPGGLQYTKGVVAMAKGGNEPPGTSGSQFFVVTGRGRPAAAGLRAARQGHRGPGRRRQDRRRADRRPTSSRRTGGHPVGQGRRA